MTDQSAADAGAEHLRGLVERIAAGEIAVLGALRKGQLRDADRLAAFVYGIARNVLNSYFRQRQRTPEAVELSPEIGSPETSDPVEQAERTAALRRGLDQLDPGDRSILLPTLVQGLKPGQIARQLGLSSEVVRTRKSRALKRLTEQVRQALGAAPAIGG